ncbi:prolyl oligopeptidase [Acidiphilium sp. MT5]
MDSTGQDQIDPFLWLEEIDGADALAWVAAANQRSTERLCTPEFEADRTTVLDILNADDRIPAIVQRGDDVYNFWTDAAHPRGLWRRTTLSDYRTDAPDWDILLDLDALGAAAQKSYVWAGASVLAPDFTRALISLSDGGADAVEIREFDLSRREFVADGFSLPNAKTQVTWIDHDTILVATAHGGDVTASGYARTVRRWRRGTAYSGAELVFEIEASDTFLSMDRSIDPGDPYTLFMRGIAFFRYQYFFQRDGEAAQLLDLPEDCDVDIAYGRLTVRTRSEWSVGPDTWPAGSLVTIRLADFLAGQRRFARIFTPEPRTALDSFIMFADHALIGVLDNVQTRILRADPDTDYAGHPAPVWTLTPLEGLPSHSAIAMGKLAPQDPQSHDALLSVSGFLDPGRLILAAPERDLETLKIAPPRFDARHLHVAQHAAIADDGTAIPYFLITPTTPQPPAGWPTILYGYGGFDVSLEPGYLGATGALWCARGGAYAVANIRGGGEFGPDWHKAGVRAGKRIAQNDFAAVAADLVSTGVTTANRIMGYGGSNGGLLVGNMLTRFPDHFGAILCTVPLLDMRRYTKLLAGHSWIAEYGDPDDPADWAFLQKISAYHLVQPGQPYPPTLIMTTRRDDRVHPGHARKMAAKLQSMGYDALYYEQDEGGHGSGADAAQRAFATALHFAFARAIVGRE